MGDLDKYFDNTSKAELVEWLEEMLEHATKAVVIVLQDEGKDGEFLSNSMTYGVVNLYEALGILEIGKQNFIKQDEETTNET